MYHTMGFPARADADFADRGTFVRRNQPGARIHLYGAQSRAGRLFDSMTFRPRFLISTRPLPVTRPLNVLVPDLTIDRCAVLLAAGLAGDALAEADDTVREIERFGGQSIKKAELLLVAANCALAAAQPQTALDRAQAADRMYRSQHNSWWLARTRLVLVQAKYAAGPVSPQLLREANRGGRAAGGTEAPAMRPRPTCWPGGWRWNGVDRQDADRHFIAAARVGGAARRCLVPAAGSAKRLRAEADDHPRRLFCRLPPRARGSGRVPVHPRCLGTAGAGDRARRRTGRARAAPCRAPAPATASCSAWSERWRATALAVR